MQQQPFQTHNSCSRYNNELEWRMNGITSGKEERAPNGEQREGARYCSSPLRRWSIEHAPCVLSSSRQDLNSSKFFKIEPSQMNEFEFSLKLQLNVLKVFTSITKWRRTMRKTLNLETPGATVATPSERRDRRRAAHLSDVSATTRPTVDSFTPNDRQGGGRESKETPTQNSIWCITATLRDRQNQIKFFFPLQKCFRSFSPWNRVKNIWINWNNKEIKWI